VTSSAGDFRFFFSFLIDRRGRKGRGAEEGRGKKRKTAAAEFYGAQFCESRAFIPAGAEGV